MRKQMKGNIITYCISAQVSSHIKFTNSPKPNEQTRTITTHSISISNRFSKCKATEYERKKKCQCQVQSRYILYEMCANFFCAFIVAVTYIFSAFFFFFFHLCFVCAAQFQFQFRRTCAGCRCDEPPSCLIVYRVFDQAPCDLRMCIMPGGRVDGAQYLFNFTFFFSVCVLLTDVIVFFLFSVQFPIHIQIRFKFFGRPNKKLGHFDENG